MKKVTLFKMVGNGINVTINTASEESMMYWFLVSRYGTTYKALKISGLTFFRMERDPDDETAEYKIVSNTGAVYNYTVPMVESAEDFKEQMKGAEIDYNSAGKYTALDFKNHVITTLEVDGRWVSAEFPAVEFNEDAVSNTDHFYVSTNIYPEILSSEWMDGSDHVTEYVMKFKQIEKKIMYQLDTKNPIDSCAFELD